MREDRRQTTCLFVVFTTLLFSGCGKNDTGRSDIWGKVNWKGQPVPSGVVYFSPDISKGARGPQGFALIQNGYYDTRAAKSKGVVPGPHVALVQGCDGVDARPGRPYGGPLFDPYEALIEIGSEGGEIDLVVPDTVSTTPVSASEDL